MKRWLIGLWALAWATVAAAHPVPESRVLIDTHADGITLTLQLPLNRLELSYGQPLADAPDQMLARHGEGLSNYLLQHVGARSGNVGWQALRPRLAVSGDSGTPDLEAVLELHAPPGADPRHFTLLYDAVTHEVRTHRGLVYLRNDWAAGQVAEPLKLLGEFNAWGNTLDVQLNAPRSGGGFLSLLKHGAHHIAEGTDHLLFLLTLLLVAPLRREGRRWAGPRATGDAVRRLLGVVTAFTVGHSVTLALGSTGIVVLPSAVVETAVAVSIFVAAMHALRPLLNRGELWMAGGFGLLHGLAFAASLSGAGLTAGQHALALLAFNLGIEAMQLLIVACIVPPLLVLAWATPRAYVGLKGAAAVAAALAALALIAERLEIVPPGAGQWLESAAKAGPMLAGLLWPAAALAAMQPTRQPA